MEVSMNTITLAVVIVWVIRTAMVHRRLNQRLDAIRDWMYDSTRMQNEINTVLIDGEAMRTLRTASANTLEILKSHPEELWMKDGLYSIGAPVLDRDVRSRSHKGHQQRKEGRN